jgi:hypothetical protein
MQEVSTTTVSFPSTGSWEAFKEVVRRGAQRLLIYRTIVDDFAELHPLNLISIDPKVAAAGLCIH